MEKTKIEELLEQRRFKELKEELEAIHPVDIVEMLEDFDRKTGAPYLPASGQGGGGRGLYGYEQRYA